MRAAAEFVRAAGRHRARARVHARLARAVRPVVVGSGAGAAAGDRAAALVGGAEHLRLRLLGAPDDRGAVARDGTSSAARAAVRAGGAARPRAVASGRADQRARSLADAPGSRAARLRASPAAAVAPDRDGARGALDRAPPGGRRLLGRHPAAVGVFADGAAPERLRARAPADATRDRGPRPVHGGGAGRTVQAGEPAGPYRSVRRSHRRAAVAWRRASRRCGTRR